MLNHFFSNKTCFFSQILTKVDELKIIDSINDQDVEQLVDDVGRLNGEEDENFLSQNRVRLNASQPDVLSGKMTTFYYYYITIYKN